MLDSDRCTIYIIVFMCIGTPGFISEHNKLMSLGSRIWETQSKAIDVTKSKQKNTIWPRLIHFVLFAVRTLLQHVSDFQKKIMFLGSKKFPENNRNSRVKLQYKNNRIEWHSWVDLQYRNRKVQTQRLGTYLGLAVQDLSYRPKSWGTKEGRTTDPKSE